MQKTIISWASASWNPAHGCSKVSEGCRHCYAERISLQKRLTSKDWTEANAEDNVTIKPHKLNEPYALKEDSRVFVNSMSDMFHREIPDWFIAAIFCVMLDNPQHVFQVLTKRPECTISWHEDFAAALQTPQFKELAELPANYKRWGKKALEGAWSSPWGANIWMGASVENARVIGFQRIDDLRKCGAQVKFLSCEPLLGSLGNLNLEGIHWVIVGGESGGHLKDGPTNPRWMKQEWAREIRDACLKQKVAYFYKQDSGVTTEQRPYLVHEDGTLWKWHQFPNALTPPVEVDAKGNIIVRPYAAYDTPLPDYDMPWDAYPPAPQTRVVSFREYWDHYYTETETWDEGYVYIGRRNQFYSVPKSPFANPFPIKHDTPAERAKSLAKYRAWLLGQPALMAQLETLRGKTLVCWCKDAAHPDTLCHGDVLIDLLNNPPAQQSVAPTPTTPEQMTMF